MACSAFDALPRVTERLTNFVYQYAAPQSLWYNAVPRGVYDQGINGLNPTTYIFGRVRPTDDEPDWPAISTTITSDPEVNGACARTWTDVNWGWDSQTYFPEEISFRGPVLCRDEMTFSTKEKIMEFMDRYMKEMAAYTEYQVAQRYQKIYMDLSNKYVTRSAEAGGAVITNFSTSLSGATYPTSVPDSELTQCHLDDIAARLNQAGAGQQIDNQFINLGPDGPTYTLYIGQVQSQRISRNLGEIRQDLRWADAPILMKRIGATKLLYNFLHKPVVDAPRFTFTGGAYVRVPYWITQAGTRGTVAIENPLYATAPYEGAIVVNRNVFTSEILKPELTAPGIKFDPDNWAGEWDWRVGGNKICDPAVYDPKELLGRHFATIRHAARPVLPKFGWLIIYKRDCAESCPEICGSGVYQAA